MLVVDDQEDVRDVAVTCLEMHGYQVVEAAGGPLALDLLGDCDTVDLLIADYAMPEMSGIELAEAARARCPDLPVVIVTGYADTGGLEGQIDATFLKKPYRMDELAAAVGGALRRERSGTPATNIVTLRSRDG